MESYDVIANQPVVIDNVCFGVEIYVCSLETHDRRRVI